MIYTKEIDLGELVMVMVPDRTMPHRMPQSSLYDRDFHQWMQVLADALRSGDWASLDVENLCEILEL